MRTWVILFAALLFVLKIPSSIAAQSISGVSAPQEDARFGQRSLYATVGGTGDCTSWSKGCSFRTAVSKCSSTKATTIYVGAGQHDLNNGSDANGTTIPCDYVRIQGMGSDEEIGQHSQFINSRNPADYVMRITGTRVTVANVAFDNSGQLDKEVTHINVRGSWATLRDIIFRQATGDGNCTGVLIDNGANTTSFQHIRFRKLAGYAINVNDATRVFGNNLLFYLGGTGIYFSHANSANSYWKDMDFYQMTTGVNVGNAASTDHNFQNVNFSQCTTNVVQSGAYNATHWDHVTSVFGAIPLIYPTCDATCQAAADGAASGGAAAGVAVAKNANAGTWGTKTTIIPASTITGPFYITGINVHSWNAAQVFVVQLFYGQVSATSNVGTWTLTLGDQADARAASTPTHLDAYIPGNSIVAARVMTDTDGSDSVTISLTYEKI
jgi:hypothetical protein